MDRESRRVRVELGLRSYDITIGYDILPRSIRGLKDLKVDRNLLVISDSLVNGFYGAFLEELLKNEGFTPSFHVLTPGEESKSWVNAEIILEKMLKANLGRNAPVLALGGGVIGDLAGFVAALYRRGVPYIQVPTSLLAQVDSSVGGKVAVNHPLGKNMIGTFYQPRAVWAELNTLTSLPREEWYAGLAEVVKYALIRDESFLGFLEENTNSLREGNSSLMPLLIEKCCGIKADIVSGDERDEGLRNTLNFGHTIGHALESATGYSKYRHGEAVAVGMMGAISLAGLLGLVDEQLGKRVERLLRNLNLPVSFPAHLMEGVLTNISYDKKGNEKGLVFILPLAPGRVIIKEGVSKKLVKVALEKVAH